MGNEIFEGVTKVMGDLVFMVDRVFDKTETLSLESDHILMTVGDFCIGLH
jgi:hypothetical protein